MSKKNKNCVFLSFFRASSAFSRICIVGAVYAFDNVYVITQPHYWQQKTGHLVSVGFGEQFSRTAFSNLLLFFFANEAGVGTAFCCNWLMISEKLYLRSWH